MSAKTYQRILQFGLFASLGIIFLLFTHLLFPYISSKQIVFNVLMELMFPFWLLLVWQFPSFRPYRSLVTAGLATYLLVILISTFSGVDFNLSFWGDTERMLGFFHIFHFFLFYLYLITAFRNRRDWSWFLSASVVIATVQAVLVLIMNKIGTIGNTAYISGYLIFNLYFALILIFRNNWRIHWPLYPALVLMLLAFFKANTSGAIIGLFSSLLLLLFLLGLFASRKKVRVSSLSILVIALAGVILLFSQYNQTWFKENKALSNLSFHKITFQTRRLSWEGAARDFKYHPWLGTGFGNYAIIFDRQFDPSFFNYSTTETYFDRAHNNLIDIISTTGVLGILAYLSIFVFLIIDWLKALKKESWRIRPGREGVRARELMLVAALIFAYFVQNLAVFDSLATYMGLMITLAYLIFFCHEPSDTEPEEKEGGLSAGTEMIILIGAFVLVLVVVFNFSIRPFKMMTKTITAYGEITSNQTEAGLASFEKALVPATPLDRDSRTVLINFLVANPSLLARGLSAEKVQASLDFVISLVERNLEYNPHDSLMQMQAAQLYDIASRYYYYDQELFRGYSDKAISAAEKAVAASPKRIPLYFILGQIQANAGNQEEAELSFKTAYSLNPDYVETHCQLANYYFLVKNEAYLTYTDTCLDKGGQSLIPDLLLEVVNSANSEDNSPRLLLAYRSLAAKGSREPLIYINLAKLELAAGNFQEAMQAAVLAGDLDESLRPAVKQFLEELQAMPELEK